MADLTLARRDIAPLGIRGYTAFMDDITTDVPDVETLEDLSEADLLTLLTRLKTEHRAVDNEIKAIAETGVLDMLKVRRMKKIKLAMKDKIAFIENQITPDIIA